MTRHASGDTRANGGSSDGSSDGGSGVRRRGREQSQWSRVSRKNACHLFSLTRVACRLPSRGCSRLSVDPQLQPQSPLIKRKPNSPTEKEWKGSRRKVELWPNNQSRGQSGSQRLSRQKVMRLLRSIRIPLSSTCPAVKCVSLESRTFAGIVLPTRCLHACNLLVYLSAGCCCPRLVLMFHV